jgi:hypothetical protein
MFLSDHVASFARKKEEEKRITLREKIIGRTNAGKAFRVGSLISGAGLGYLALKNRKALGALKKPVDFYSSDVTGKDVTTMRRKQKVIRNPDFDKYLFADEWKGKIPDEYKQVYDKDWHDVRRTEKDGRSFVGTGRKVNWGRVGKTVGIGGTALAIPTGLAYAAGSKKDKEDIKNRAGNVTRATQSTLKDARSWVNTLHRVSR